MLKNLSANQNQYVQTKKEEILNSTTHFSGAVLAAAGGIPLIISAASTGSGLVIFSMTAYILSLITLYSVSGFYHAVRQSKLKQILRVADHCTIYLLILGTYIPFSLVVVGGKTGLAVCITNALLSVLGVALNIIDMKRFEKASMVLYVLIGWLAVAFAPSVFRALSVVSLIFLVAGDLSYTVGILFFRKNKPYMHVVWHFFVLAGSVLQYLSIFMYMKG